MFVSVHNTRILRFLLVIGAVILTIFIYASYSTGPQLGPSHMHTHLTIGPESLLQPLPYQNRTGAANAASGSYISSSGSGSSTNFNQKQQANVHDASKRKMYYHQSNAIDVSPIKKYHRQPTVDVDAGGSDIASNNPIYDGPADEVALDRFVNNYFLEEQYLSNVDNAMGNINNSAGSTIAGDGGTVNGNGNNAKRNGEGKANADKEQRPDQLENTQNDVNGNKDINNKNNVVAPNKLLDSDVLIPTSNLQKFIENADKILKNMTSVSSNKNVQASQTDKEKVEANQQQEVKDAETKKSVDAKVEAEDAVGDDDGDDYDEHNSVVMTIRSGGDPNKESNVEQKDVQQDESPSKPQPQPQSPPKEAKKNDIESLSKVGKVMENKKVEVGIEKAKVVTKAVLKPAADVRQSEAASKAASKPASAADKKDMKKSSPSQAGPGAMAIQIPNKAVLKNTTNQAANKPIDTSQGIQTFQLYESGHLDEEVDMERICPNKGNDIKLLILITSAQSHMEARLAVRQTWGHYGSRRDVSMAFVIGRSDNRTLNLALTQENFIYGDLIRGNFIDSYNNLTLKTISSLEWVDKHCPHAKFILKTDDDMFINVPKLLKFLESHGKDKRTIFGRLAKKWKPVRNKKSKYYVSTTQFSATVFPSFTTGPAYVLTNDIVHELYEHSLQQVYLKLEDVFTTGIVAQQLNIKRVHVNEFLNRRIAFNPCNIRKTISVHMIKANEQFDLWKKLLDQTTKCK